MLYILKAAEVSAGSQAIHACVGGVVVVPLLLPTSSMTVVVTRPTIPAVLLGRIGWFESGHNPFRRT